MHELSIATAIHRSCHEELARRGGGRLIEVKVAIGELSAVEPDLLGFAWEAVTAEGPDAGARLDIEWHRVRQLCDACGDVGDPQPGSWLRLCPDCSQPLRLEGGRELDLITIDYETPDRAGYEDRNEEAHP